MLFFIAGELMMIVEIPTSWSSQLPITMAYLQFMLGMVSMGCINLGMIISYHFTFSKIRLVILDGSIVFGMFCLVKYHLSMCGISQKKFWPQNLAFMILYFW